MTIPLPRGYTNLERKTQAMWKTVANRRIVLHTLQKDRGLSNKMIKQQF